MPKRERYHVTPDGDRWKVQKEGAQRAVKTFDNKEDAVDFGRQTAKNQPLGQALKFIRKMGLSRRSAHTERTLFRPRDDLLL